MSARFFKQCLGWIAAVCVMLWRLTCRYRVENDPRPKLRQSKTPYVYALLHAHQVAAVFVNDETTMAAMVSRSGDGDLLVPSLRMRRVLAVRGSSRKAARDKGGAVALQELATLTQRGVPALLAVDGPRGPRNSVHVGVAALAQQTDAVILPVAVLPNRRWILRGTWDRMQLPQPLCTIRLIFGVPLRSGPHESADSLRLRVADALSQLEHVHDKKEAEFP